MITKIKNKLSGKYGNYFYTVVGGIIFTLAMATGAILFHDKSEGINAIACGITYFIFFPLWSLCIIKDNNDYGKRMKKYYENHFK